MLPAAARACTTHGVPVCKKHVDKKIYKFSLACRQIEAHVAAHALHEASPSTVVSVRAAGGQPA
jgi:hypothetical protein